MSVKRAPIFAKAKNRGEKRVKHKQYLSTFSVSHPIHFGSPEGGALGVPLRKRDLGRWKISASVKRAPFFTKQRIGAKSGYHIEQCKVRTL